MHVRSCFLAGFLMMIFLFAPMSTQALPRFTASNNQACNLCHHDPTGGGMRNIYGAQFTSNAELPMNPLTDMADLEKFNPMLGEYFQIGGDARTMFWTDELDSLHNSFLLMQADVYLAFMPSDKLMLYLEQGIGGWREAFILMQDLPLRVAIRAGQFVPSYGWQFADHKAFTREYLGFFRYSRTPAISEDRGVEIGFYPEGLDFTAAITNGSAGSTVDRNRSKALTVRASKRLQVGDLALSLGGNYRYDEQNPIEPILRYYGGMYSAYLKPFTVIGELDWVAEDTTTQMVSTILAIAQIRQGIHGIIGYDYYDPDIDWKTGHVWRVKVGYEMFLTSYFEMAPALYYREQDNVFRVFSLMSCQRRLASTAFIPSPSYRRKPVPRISFLTVIFPCCCSSEGRYPQHSSPLYALCGLSS